MTKFYEDPWNHDKFYNDAWYDARWNSMPLEMKRRAVDAIRVTMTQYDLDLVVRKHAEYGHDWIHHLIDINPDELAQFREAGLAGPEETTLSAHHGFGTQMRNVLRSAEHGAGITDDELPDAPYESGQSHRNWDDFYLQVIEAAAGLR